MFDGPGALAPTTPPPNSGNSNGTTNGIGYADGSRTGNHDFGNSGYYSKYFVAPGATSHNGLTSAPTNPFNSASNVWECNGVNGSSGSSQSYVVYAFPTLSGADQNGILQMPNNYTDMVSFV